LPGGASSDCSSGLVCPKTFAFTTRGSTAASLAIADGASLFDVSWLLGHKDRRATANQHGHLFAEGRWEMASA